LPAPITTARPAVPGSVSHGVRERAGAWLQGQYGQVYRTVLRRCHQEGVGESDGPQTVLGIHLRSPAAAEDAHELVELGFERLHDVDVDLRHIAAEGRGIAVDQLRPLEVRARKGQVLSQVVQLEHALVADDHQVAALGRREPVHVEKRGGAGGKAH
jgi:hypothetical protein